MSEEDINLQEGTQDGAQIIAPYMRSLLERFEPAPTPIEASHFYSTREIDNAIKEICPYLKGYSLYDIDAAMRRYGYELGSPYGIGLSLKWMLRERIRLN